MKATTDKPPTKNNESSRHIVRNIFSVPDEGIFQGKSNDNFELLKAWAGTT